jgi:hypothetical protein
MAPSSSSRLTSTSTGTEARRSPTPVLPLRNGCRSAQTTGLSGASMNLQSHRRVLLGVHFGRYTPSLTPVAHHMVDQDPTTPRDSYPIGCVGTKRPRPNPSRPTDCGCVEVPPPRLATPRGATSAASLGRRVPPSLARTPLGAARGVSPLPAPSTTAPSRLALPHEQHELTTTPASQDGGIPALSWLHPLKGWILDQTRGDSTLAVSRRGSPRQTFVLR